jgi:uncharacterized membrane protein YhaH (DUF805 family)
MSNILLPRGRMRRAYYWLFGFILSLIMGFIPQASGGADDIYVYGIILAPFIWISIMMGVQRAHDIGSKVYARLWAISAIVLVLGVGIARGSEPGSQPVIGIAMLASLAVVFVMNLLFLFKAGTVGPNEFGEDPRGRSAPQTAEGSIDKRMEAQF